jgi:hypothetical protein
MTKPLPSYNLHLSFRQGELLPLWDNLRRYMELLCPKGISSGPKKMDRCGSFVYADKSWAKFQLSGSTQTYQLVRDHPFVAQISGWNCVTTDTIVTTRMSASIYSSPRTIVTFCFAFCASACRALLVRPSVPRWWPLFRLPRANTGSQHRAFAPVIDGHTSSVAF